VGAQPSTSWVRARDTDQPRHQTVGISPAGL